MNKSSHDCKTPAFFASIAIFVGTAFAFQAQAGEVLRLKTGSVRLTDSSEQMLLGTLNPRQPLMPMMATEALEATKYYVVQFAGTIPQGADTRLSSLGLESLRYLPDDSLLVRGAESAAAIVKGTLPEVRAVAHFNADWKISDEFRDRIGMMTIRPERIVVSTVDRIAARAVAGQIRTIPGAELLNARTPDLIVDAEPAAVERIAALEGVEWIQKLPIFVTFDYPMEIVGQDDGDPSVEALARRTRGPRDSTRDSQDAGVLEDYQYTGHESGTKLMNFEAAWSRGFMGEGQIVAVADTGLDLGKVETIHPDFKGNLIKGYAIGLGSESWEDPMGHGTHVAGSVLGNGTASQNRIRGGAFRASLLMEGLWSSILDNLAPGSDFNKLLGTPYKDGARIHTNSWGAAANFGVYDSFAARVDEFMFNNPDMIVLFAAGNSGEDKNADGRIDENSISSPGTAKNVLTVGASENLLLVGGIQKPLSQLRNGDKKWGAPPLKDDLLANNGDGMAAFSSRGPTNDGRIKPEIVAPGTNIISVKSRHPKAEKLWGEFNTDYVYSGGTSMSTPLTAGAAAVAREFLIKDRKIESPSGALVKATLMHTAYDMYPGQYGTGPKQELPTHRPNVHEGYGRVDMDQATAIGNETQIVDNRTGVGTGEAQSVPVRVRAGAALRVTLSYFDAPASPSAAKALVNDLDLTVVDAAGNAKTLNDHTNNTEMLELSGLAAGEYTVVVKGTSVPKGKNGKQPYALLISIL